MPTFAPNLIKTAFRTIRCITQVGLVVAFFVLGLFWAFSDVSAGTTYYSTDFEDFDLGNVSQNEDWTGNCDITDFKSYSGDKSLYLNQSGSDEAWLIHATTTMDGYSYLSFNLWTSGGSSAYEFWTGYWAVPGTKFKLRITDNYIYPYNCPTYKAYIEPGSWHNIVINWCYGEPECGGDNEKSRIKVDDGEWQNWCSGGIPVWTMAWWNKLGGIEYYYIDDIAITDFEPGCSVDNCGDCLNWFSCGDVGCCWYETWWGWPGENECISCPTGDCGEGPLDCQNCLSTTTCAIHENCYWANELCKYGTGECGPGLSCDFCYSSSTCIAQDCFWYDTYCWFSGPIEVSDWATYYAEHGDYATSTAWIDGLASKTGTMFNSLSGFLTGFVNAFDNSEAQAQGVYFGSVIPEARGHLNSINMFFGELPVAQAFLFLITFLVAIGIFRLIRNIIALIKFW